MEENVFKIENTEMENTSVYWNKIEVKKEVGEEVHTLTVGDYSVNSLNSASIIKQELQTELSTAIKFEEYTSLDEKESNIYDNINLHKVGSKLKHSKGKRRRRDKLQRTIMKGQDLFTRIIVCTVCGNAYTKKDEYFFHFSTQHFIKQKKLGKTQLKTRDIENSTFKTDADNEIEIVEDRLELKLQENKNCVQLNIIDNIQPSSKIIYNSNDTRQFSCEICSKSFSQKCHLTGELDNCLCRHTGEEPFKCDVCSKTFFQKSDLNIHMPCHTVEKPFKCVVCLKSFSLQYHLKRHSRSHTGEKPFNCFMCLKAFSHKSYLSVHLRRHTGEKPFKCDICLKAFLQICDLNKHLLCHQKKKSFSCDVCSKSFSQERYLQKHAAKLHTEQKPFKCDFCLKYFSWQRQFETHLCDAIEKLL